MLPWARQALGGDLPKLRYDVALSQLQTVSLPEVHGGLCETKFCSVQHVGTGPPGDTGKSSLALEEIQRELRALREVITKHHSPELQVSNTYKNCKNIDLNDGNDFDNDAVQEHFSSAPFGSFVSSNVRADAVAYRPFISKNEKDQNEKGFCFRICCQRRPSQTAIIPPPIMGEL